MSNPYQPPSYDPKYFQDQPYAHAPVINPGYGYVSQVRVVAILNCVQGGLEIPLGLMLTVAAVFVPWAIRQDRANGGGAEPPPEMEWILGAGYGIIGGALLICGILRIYAGIQNYRFRQRTVGLVSFFVGLASMIACYCAPTSIGVLVYGLIVYMNPAVKAAFEMGKQGMSGDQIVASFMTPGTTPFKPQQPS